MSLPASTLMCSCWRRSISVLTGRFTIPRNSFQGRNFFHAGTNHSLALRQKSLLENAPLRRRVTTALNQNIYNQQVRFHGDDDVPEDAPVVHFSFVTKDKTEIPVEAKVGQNLLRVAQKNEVELEGACECSIACSTCHVILDPDFYDTLEHPCEDEEDMLDMAFGLTETSRLGCQIHITKDMEGTKVELPQATRNFYVDGHVPEPH
eukprot:CAMPEP_0204843368 /NCGR_PEP_ID=MMETSP1346-20131115/47939_1 /ASSEMBLY_ACC=CAM_ASM_000771 /TAXON_ID=215587 /ORGANISM="Aplanochytrium stocchinoi, Strain GSBS06" /LENGTH=205 /DNA_ID=CAMNT_0051982499 /DNA_START=41 /DNA_END=658 /DNA_ORIENTATION=+